MSGEKQDPKPVTVVKTDAEKAADPFHMLSAEEKDAIRKEVLADLERDAKEKAKLEFKEIVKRRERMKAGIGEQREKVTIDLAPYCNHILIDNVSYFQGQTVEVRTPVAIGFREIMQRTWEHQSQIEGKNENWYRRMRGVRVTPHGVVNDTRSLLRA